MLPPLPADAPANPPLLVGYSGGLDSTVLLHSVANDANLRVGGLRAIHVHHGLQVHADDWAEHCRRFCDLLEVPLTVVRVDVDRDSGEGLEAAARQARYAAIRHALTPGEVLVTAHHRDDQAETFLLRALRASGPDGLAAMRPWRAFGQGWHWRPLLDMPRAALLAYAREHGLEWLEDDSNLDTALDRNFLRLRVLPLLRERWPQADASFARTAGLQAEAVALLDEGDACALTQVRTIDPQVLRADVLRTLPAARRARVLRRWITALGLPPLPAQGVVRIESDLLAEDAAAGACFAWAGAVVERWCDLLHAGVQRAPLSRDWSATWSMDAPLVLPTGDVLAIECSEEDRAASPGRDVSTSVAPAPALPLRAHARRGGERIVLPGRAHSHALKHVLQELEVPPWERARLPLLSSADGELLAAGDLVYSAGFDAWLRGRGARLVWSRSL